MATTATTTRRRTTRSRMNAECLLLLLLVLLLLVRGVRIILTLRPEDLLVCVLVAGYQRRACCLCL